MSRDHLATPIQTMYKGHRFRSRLEARWAVFFDAYGIEWEYEKEGYELPSGWYLPDFWLPNASRCCGRAGEWLEIKPSIPGAEEIAKCSELRHHTKSTVNLVAGYPWDFYIYVWSMQLQLLVDGAESGRGTEARDLIAYMQHWAGVLPGEAALRRMDLVKAVSKARSARFEFGETPR